MKNYVSFRITKDTPLQFPHPVFGWGGENSKSFQNHDFEGSILRIFSKPHTLPTSDQKYFFIITNCM